MTRWNVCVAVFQTHFHGAPGRLGAPVGNISPSPRRLFANPSRFIRHNASGAGRLISRIPASIRCSVDLIVSIVA